MQSVIFKFIYLTIYFLPLAFVIGPFLVEFLVIISSSLFIFYIIKNKKFEIFNNYFFKFFLSFYILLLISSFFSENFLISLKSTLPYFRWGIFFLIIKYTIENNRYFTKTFSKIVIILVLIILFDAFFQLISNKNILGFKIIVSHRISSFFRDELILGGFLLKLLPFCLIFLLSYIKKNFNYFFLFFLFFLILGIFITGERSSFYLSILYLFLFFLLKNKNNLKIFIAFIILILISLTFIINYKPQYQDRMFNQIYDQFFMKNNISHFKNLNLFSKQHESHIISAYLMFSKGNIKDKIFGIGPKNFRILCKEPKYCNDENCCSTHPHNIPIQILAETGIFGFLFYILFLIILCFIIFKQFYFKFFKKKLFLNDRDLSIVLSFFIFIYPFTTSGDFFGNKNSFFFYMLLGFFSCISYFNKIKNKI